MKFMNCFSNNSFDGVSTEMTGLSFSVCPKCTGKYLGKPAISRVDGSNICPMCGHREALQASVDAGILNKKVADDMLDKIKEIEKEKGIIE